MNELLVNLSMVFSQPTGISNYALNLFPHLKALTPTLLTVQDYPEFQCEAVPNNLTPAQGSKGHLRRLVWTQLQLPQIYQKLAAKLLFSPLPEAPLFTNCRYIIQVHDLIPLRFPNWRSPLTNYARYYVPQILTQAQHIICNSHSTAKDITEFYKIPARKITPVLLAYDSNHFRPFPEKLEKDTNRKPYFLYLGRHDKYKNINRLVTAFAALPNNQDYELWLAGPTDKRFTPNLRVQIAELGITKRVKILDYVIYSELPKIISNALAFVFPSLWEGFGFPVLEAMACGTPVITSNLSSLPEVTSDVAILINPYNVQEITAAMREIASDTTLQAKLSQLGLLRAKQFSWEKTGLATVEVLKKFI
ncbi:glycosyl transferase [Dulcicalothrix desertica PCC 7102]|uniref:Glycosyl transferase n=1 Tax=Dulcicalothrix desertica PCC 7102 TaxID=232991 RepID=A0A433V9X1_9CYAN|nr:glycosyltransferase family 1 protein [Dulcicalothrix desertica]RUT02906.1 glycosyl transferase [Dulcicalothrix desertica PCC 7102]TWH38864.1 glycosyltransferase involved in cell wall biosynthesis [Dulcicalothrix desertica PCC 7102]